MKLRPFTPGNHRPHADDTPRFVEGPALQRSPLLRSDFTQRTSTRSPERNARTDNPPPHLPHPTAAPCNTGTVPKQNPHKEFSVSPSHPTPRACRGLPGRLAALLGATVLSVAGLVALAAPAYAAGLQITSISAGSGDGHFAGFPRTPMRSTERIVVMN
jgi:hypothetical protein